MADRREFIKASLATVACVATLKVTDAFASNMTPTVLPKGLLYTTEEPGKWAGKAGSHAPIVTVKGNQVTVKTKHGMSTAHYIVRHTVVDQSGAVLGEKTFASTDSEAVSVFEIKATDTVLYATSFCNKHDLWVTSFIA